MPAGFSAILILLLAMGGCGGPRPARVVVASDAAPALAAASDPIIRGGLAVTPVLVQANRTKLRRMGLPGSPDDPVRIRRDREAIWAAVSQDPHSQILVIPPVTPRSGAEAASVFAADFLYTRDALLVPGGLSPIADRIRYGNDFIAAAEVQGEAVVLRQARWTSVVVAGCVECHGGAADGTEFHWQELVVNIAHASLPQPIELRLGEAVAIPVRWERRRGTATVRQHLKDIREGPEPRHRGGLPVALVVFAGTLEKDEGDSGLPDGNERGGASTF